MISFLDSHAHEAAFNLMDGTFTLTDMIMIVGGAFSIAKLYYNQIQRAKLSEEKDKAQDTKIQEMKEAHEKQLNEFKEEIEKQKEVQKAYYKDAKDSRAEIRKDYKEADEKNQQIIHSRVDKLQLELKEDRKDNKEEFKSINDKLNSLAATSEAILMHLQNKK